MKIEPIPNGSLRIWLPQEDGGIPPRVRRLVQAVQTRLAQKGKRLLAELFPVDDGWILLLSVWKKPSVGGVLVYRVDGVRALFRLAEQWALLSTSLPPAPNALYEAGDSYYVVIYPTPHLQRRRTALVQEFGSLLGQGDIAAAYAAERGRLLAAGDALGRLVVTSREPRPPTPSGRES